MMHADAPRSDARPVLVFIWWPIVLVGIVGGAVLLFAFVSGASFSGGAMPLVIVGVIALGAIALLPVLVKHTRAEFRGRGFRGFWKSSRDTEWGDGI